MGHKYYDKLMKNAPIEQRRLYVFRCDFCRAEFEVTVIPFPYGSQKLGNRPPEMQEHDRQHDAEHISFSWIMMRKDKEVNNVESR